MFRHSACAAIALAALGIAGIGAQAQEPSKTDASRYDPAKYPDWSGPMRWIAAVGGGNRYDPSKPTGRGQQAPLTPEYQAKFEAGLKDQAAGGQGANQTYACLPGGMPRDMAGNQGAGIRRHPPGHPCAVRPGGAAPDLYRRSRLARERGSVLLRLLDRAMERARPGRPLQRARGRDPQLQRPRSFDNAGIPLHADNQTVIRERIYRDKQNSEIIHDEMTTIDHALSHPWTVDKTYRLQKSPHWVQNICSVGNMHVQIGSDAYFLSADGLLMPVKKDQAPPDLRYFKQSQK